MNVSLCEEQAHEHWKTVHADLTMAAENTGVDILRYVQFHMDKKHRNSLKPLLDTGSVVLAPYDGIAEFHAKDAASVLRFIDHAFQNETIIKDQMYFVDGSSPLQIMAGYDTLIFGSGIDTSDGTDGILPGDPRLVNEPEY
ncbi:hypothetical protein N0V90_010018 [Kalmusia sp. IMI 367209]|nr:hypothetical protein N0V90_010018 [Kalmusia sp. IMI 367209]